MVCSEKLTTDELHMFKGASIKKMYIWSVLDLVRSHTRQVRFESFDSNRQDSGSGSKILKSRSNCGSPRVEPNRFD